MKYLLQKTVIAITILTCFVACTIKDEISRFDQIEPLHFPVTRSVAENEISQVRTRLISKEMLPMILKGFIDPKTFENTEHYSLSVIAADDEDLIYVVNFDEGGWVLVSGVLTKESPILALSSSGHFESDEIKSPETAFWLDATKRKIKGSFDEMTLEKTSSNNRLSKGELNTSSSIKSLGDSYFWIQYPIDTTITTTNLSIVYPLLHTKWGQEYPWNYKCPMIDDVQSPTGCVAVAYAQEFYYLHNYLGEPTSLYHQIDTCYDWHYTHFMPSHEMTNRVSPSPRWEEMPLLNPGYQTIGTNYVGDLMIEIGQQVFMKYYYNLSETALNTSIFSNYGLSYSSSDFDSSIAITQLNDSIPLIIGAYRNPPEVGGHAWIIDGHQSTQTTWTRSFQWRRIPEELMNQFLDFVRFSDRDMRMFYPDVVENQIDYEQYQYYSCIFSMNWGWDGVNDGFFTMSTIDYPYEPRMIYGFQIRQL